MDAAQTLVHDLHGRLVRFHLHCPPLNSMLFVVIAGGISGLGSLGFDYILHRGP